MNAPLHKSVNTVVAAYVSYLYFMLSSPLCAKGNMEALILWENVIYGQLFTLSFIFIYITHCIYVYFIVFNGQSVILK